MADLGDRGQDRAARRWRQRLAAGTGLGLVALAAACTLFALSAGPGLIADRATAALRAAGYGQAAVAVESVGLSSTTLTVKLAGDQGIDRVMADYSLPGLLNGRLDRLVVTGLRLTLAKAEDGLRPVGFDPPPGNATAPGQGGWTLPDLPVGVVELRQALLSIDLGDGKLAVPLSAELRPGGPGAMAAVVEAGLDLGPVAGTARISGDIGPTGLTADFQLTPVSPDGASPGDGQAAQAAQGAAALMDGSGRIAWQPGAPPSGTLSLHLVGARLPDGTALDMDLAWTGAATAQRLDALIRHGGLGSLQVGAGARPGDGGGAWVVDGSADLVLSDLVTAGRMLGLPMIRRGVGTLSLRAQGAPLAAALPPLDVALRLDGLAWEGAVRDAQVALTGRLTPTGDGWSLAAGEAMTLEAVPDGALAAVLPPDLRSGPLFLSLRPPAPDRPARLDLTGGDRAGVGVGAELAGRTLSLTAAMGAELGSLALGGQLDAVTLRLPGQGAGPTVTVALSDAALDGGPWPVALRGMGGRVAWESGAERPLDLSLRAETVRLAGDPPILAPFTATLALGGDPAGSLSVQAEGSAASGAILAEVFGTASPATGAADLAVQLYPVRFGEGGRDPADLSPRLARSVDAAEGTLALKGRIIVPPDGSPDRAGSFMPFGADGRAELLLEGVGMTGRSVVVQGLNAVVTAESLNPLRMPVQEVSIALLDMGLPLTDGILRYQVLGHRRLRVEQATFAWAGGAVRTGPLEADLSDLIGRFTLEAEGLDLGQVLARAGVEGLAATGTLNGRIPVVVDKDGIRFEKGELVAAGPGSLAYDPSDPPSFLDPSSNDSTALVMQALKNFRYTDLSITLDGAAGGEMAATLRLAGANPDFYGGYPVSLNLNLSGALATILQSGVTTYRIPETVRARIEEFRTKAQ
ncbi:MAG: hypothetical protein RLY86_3907 [Pseudomonadota bacterium]|jgi:hypothetical protein